MSSHAEFTSPAPKAGWLARHLPKPPELAMMELFVALSLTVCFFFLVKPLCAPKANGDMFSTTTFAYMSGNMGISSKLLMYAWRTRVLAPLSSSWLLDTQIKGPTSPGSKYHNFVEVAQSPEFQNIFGLYHAGWLFLTFLILILFRQDALLLMVGVFAGLMYNFANPIHAYCYPWDMPAMFFFTLACLLFDRGRIWLLLPVVLVGTLFKETVLACSLLVLLGRHWDWKKRVGAFLLVVTVTLAANRMLMAHYGVQMPLLAMNNATQATGLFHNTNLFGNIKRLFDPVLDHVVFANAGVLFLLLLLPWRSRRDVVLKVVTLAFVAGQFFYGLIVEVRIWQELLPLGWMLTSETVARWESDFATGMAARPADRAERIFKATHRLTLLVGSILALGVFAIASFRSPPKSSAETMPSLIASAKAGDAIAQYQLGNTYVDQQDYDSALPWLQLSATQGFPPAQFRLGSIYYYIKHDSTNAATWFGNAAAQGHATAMYHMGMLYWNDGKYREALPFFEDSAQRGDMYSQWMLGTIHLNANDGDLLEAYKWLKLAQNQGYSQARDDLKRCAGKMTREQIAEAEAQVKKILEANQAPH